MLYIFSVWVGGRVFFFAVWAGDGSSLDYRSAWLVFKRPSKKKKRSKKRTRVPGFLWGLLFWVITAPAL